MNTGVGVTNFRTQNQVNRLRLSPYCDESKQKPEGKTQNIVYSQALDEINRNIIINSSNHSHNITKSNNQNQTWPRFNV